MHLSDIIELAKEVRSRTKARDCHICVYDEGHMTAFVWHPKVRGAKEMYVSITHYDLGLESCRTPEDVLAMVDRWIERLPATLTNADLGLNDDGTFIQPVPAFLNPQAAE